MYPQIIKDKPGKCPICNETGNKSNGCCYDKLKAVILLLCVMAQLQQAETNPLNRITERTRSHVSDKQKDSC